jgi:phage replication O-like protein O
LANPQTENGCFRIANEIAERLQRTDLSKGESKILWVVFRQTYGWNKKADQISLTQFQQKTGMTRQGVCQSIQSLVNRRILGSKQSLTGGITSYWLIKDYEKWRSGSKQSLTSQQPLQKVVNSRCKTSQQPLTHKRHITKDNITKDRGKNHFTPPTLQEVTQYCRERRNNIDPQAFIDFYESKGWLIGKNKMKDWKAAIRTWERRQNDRTDRTLTIPPDL